MSKIFIAHRGNISGPNPARENQPTYINEALNLGYHVEIDVWLLGSKYYLGHDKPTYIVSPQLMSHYRVWSHCKNLAALDVLTKNPEANCFAHNTDDYVLTSKSYIWTHYNSKEKLTNNSIIVLPERTNGRMDLNQCAGFCSDNIEEYRLQYGQLMMEHVEIQVD